MHINTQCGTCGGRVVPKMKKLAVVLGGAAAVWFAGMMLATPVGWMALIPAAFAGSVNASRMISLKMKMWHCSREAGSYFECSNCGRDVGLGEVFTE
jgi:hypothetical protein